MLQSAQRASVSEQSTVEASLFVIKSSVGTLSLYLHPPPPPPQAERGLSGVIIWLAPRAGKMSQILRCDWLPERAR